MFPLKSSWYLSSTLAPSLINIQPKPPRNEVQHKKFAERITINAMSAINNKNLSHS